jgi:hypothetical protein
MSKIVPLISSGTAGPLGILHLPRLWLKVSLEERGKLAEGYPGCGKGYDSMVLEALGLQEDAVRNFIRSERPTYAAFEAWIASRPGVRLDSETVAALNAAITGYIHAEATRVEILRENALVDGPKDAVNLNNLDDWFLFHQAELK